MGGGSSNLTCMESKKKNMMRRETEAPKGRHIACTLSRVVTLFSRLKKGKVSTKTVKVNTKTVKVNTKTAKVNTKTVKVKDEIFVSKRRWTACKQVCKTFEINLNDF